MAKLMTIFAAVVMALAAWVGTSGVAVGQDERLFDRQSLILFRDAGYGGPQRVVRGDESDLYLNWRPNSVRVPFGRWQLCERTAFRGTCRTVDRDTPLLALRGLQVQSVRRLDAPPMPEQPTLDPQNRSMRGNFAEFYTAPTLNRQRVRACDRGAATAACAEREADRFCRAVGWLGSARQHLETVGREVYLADVLCVRSGY